MKLRFLDINNLKLKIRGVQNLTVYKQEIFYSIERKSYYENGKSNDSYNR